MPDHSARNILILLGMLIVLLLIAAATHPARGDTDYAAVLVPRAHEGLVRQVVTDCGAELYPFGCAWSLDYSHYATAPYSWRIDGAGGVYSTGVIGPMWIYDCRAGGWRVENISTDTWWNPCLHTVWVDDVTGDVATVPEPTGIIAVGALLLLVLPWIVSARSHPP